MKNTDRQLEYQRCKQEILDHVGQNHLKPGTLLPSQRELCGMFGHSMITVRRALKELEENDIVKAKAGKGVFVTQDLSYALDCGRILLLDLNAPERLLPPLELNILGRRMAQLGYRFEMLACGDHPAPYVSEKAVGSIGILATGFISEPWKFFLLNLPVPVVVIGDNNGNIPGLKTVYGDSSEGIGMTFDYFLKRNCRHFGFLNSPLSYIYTETFRKAFQEALSLHKLDPEQNPAAFISNDNRYAEVFDFLKTHADSIDCLLIESGIFSFVLQAYYANEKLKRLPLAIVGSTVRRVFSSSENIVQFGHRESIFQFALNVLLDSFRKPGLRYYKDDMIKAETVLIN